MKSRINSLAKGFTLIEVIFVIALLSIAASLALVISVDAVGRSTAARERDLLVALLQTARAEALANESESAHGVHVDTATHTLVLFSGSSYSSGAVTNRPSPYASAVTITGHADVVFEPLSGSVSLGAGTLTLADPATTLSVEVNAEGRIDW